MSTRTPTFGTNPDGTWWLVATRFRQILPDGTEMCMPVGDPIVFGQPPEEVYREAAEKAKGE